MKNNWNDMRNLKAPEELKARTLTAARELRQSETAPQHIAPHRPWGMTKRILAAACAFGVVLGGTAVYQMKNGTAQSGGAAVADALTHSFGFAAYAADTGELRQPKDSKIVFDSSSGVDDPEKGFYSGCLFKVTGEDIKTVSASIDKGGLYRTKTVKGPNDSQETRDAWVAAMYRGTNPDLNGADQVMVWGSDEMNMYADLCWKLDNGFADGYDADTSYGLWCPSQPENKDEDLQQSWHESVDFFEGAKLTVTVTFTDGTEQTRTLTLHTGKLGIEFTDDASGPVLTGEVLTEEQAEKEGYIYGVYAEIG